MKPDQVAPQGPLQPSDLAIATTPKETVYSRDMVRLFRYHPLGERRHRTPVLVVYALVGRYQMLDLEPRRSFIRKLLEQGFDVYLVDWGHPGPVQRWGAIDDYVCGYLDECVDEVRRTSGSATVNLLGVCQGGVFSMCYAALFGAKVRNLVLTVTPIDFHADIEKPQHGAGYVNLWTRALSGEDVDRLVDAFAGVPGPMVGASFMMMSPASNLAKYAFELPKLAGDRERLASVLRMERWISDRPHHPAEVTRQWFKELYQENRLVKGTLVLDGRPVRLHDIRVPVLNIHAEGDLPVPNACSRSMQGHFGSTDYTELGVPGGHIGTFVGAKAQAVLVPAISGWLAARDGAAARGRALPIRPRRRARP